MKGPDPDIPLTPKQKDIVCLAAFGYENEVIAGIIGIDMETVRTQLSRLSRILGVGDRTAKVCIAFGVIAPPAYDVVAIQQILEDE